MNVHDDISLEWAILEGEGLVRVFPVANFKSGFALTAQIGMVSEALGYFPQVVLTTDKVTVTIPQQSEGLDHQLAHAIDSALSDAARA